MGLIVNLLFGGGTTPRGTGGRRFCVDQVLRFAKPDRRAVIRLLGLSPPSLLLRADEVIQ